MTLIQSSGAVRAAGARTVDGQDLSVVVVIPTYNELENLAATVSRALTVEGVQLLIVDDESPDGTGALADSLSAAHRPRVSVLHRQGPRGLGRAYVDGFRAALTTGADIICQMDADGSHDPEELPSLIARLTPVDLAIGSRYVAGARVSGWPLSRHLLSRVGNGYIRLITGLHIHDVTSGFRAWRRSALQSLPLDRIRSVGHGFQVEMTHAATLLNLRIVETPISFRNRQGGVSKVSPRIVGESLAGPWRIAYGTDGCASESRRDVPQ
jgi:dolichol-phosphate mannosyltransferase